MTKALTKPLTMPKLWIVALASLAVLAAACSSSGGSDDAGTGTNDEVTADDGDAPEPAGAPTVSASDTALGVVLADADGFTLYTFANDTEGTSNCADGCAEAWPPVLVDGGPVAGPDVDGSLLGTTERADGTTQLTYDGRPLYRFGGDPAPGDTNGEGVADVWFVVPLEDAGANDGGDDGGTRDLPY